MQQSVELSGTGNMKNKDLLEPTYNNLVSSTGRMSHRQSNPSFGSSDLSSMGDPVTPPTVNNSNVSGMSFISSSSSSSSSSGVAGSAFTTSGGVSGTTMYSGSNDILPGFGSHSKNQHHHSLSIPSTLSEISQQHNFSQAPSTLAMSGLSSSSISTTFPSALPSPSITSGNLPLITPPSDSKYLNKFNSSNSFNLSPISGSRDDYPVRDMSRMNLGKSGRSDSFPPSPGSRFLFDSGFPLPSNGNAGTEIKPSLTPPPTHKRMPSYLQAETTDDKFPILVRRESATFLPTGSAGANTPRAQFIGSHGFPSESAVLDMLDPSPILIESAWNNSPQQVPQVQHLPRGSTGSLGLNGSADIENPNINLDSSKFYTHHPISGDQHISQGIKVPDSNINSNQFDVSPPLQSVQSSSGHNSYFVPYIQPANNGGLHLRSDSGSQISTSLHSKAPQIDEYFLNERGSLSVNQPAQKSKQQSQHPQQQVGPQHGQNISSRHNSTTMGNGHSTMNSTKLATRESNRRQSSRRNEQDSNNRFSQASLESLVHEIYSLCKDQHGCRFLQKKLEEKNPTYLNIIFNETYPHVVELMTDPFGNYLCQKLLEYATDEQRTTLIRTAAPSLVKIALNQHGTRALQKMIEFISTPQQVDMIVIALKTNVVKLIKDLNGNHVVQKCLNRLQADGSQFIFDAVCKNCVVVGSHRHGCCVLQRCIDHASDSQRKQLVEEITLNAFTLVQDPFGNYVTQYVLDLDCKEFSEPLIRQFIGHACMLSMQKFSSNVIEKCLRIADRETANLLIEELVDSPNLDKLLRDSYANYVIQTALDYAEAGTRQRLVDNIRPIIPSIRSTPYGRRIQSKLSSTTSGKNGNVASSSNVSPSSKTKVPEEEKHLLNGDEMHSSNLASWDRDI